MVGVGKHTAAFKASTSLPLQLNACPARGLFLSSYFPATPAHPGPQMCLHSHPQTLQPPKSATRHWPSYSLHVIAGWLLLPVLSLSPLPRSLPLSPSMAQQKHLCWLPGISATPLSGPGLSTWPSGASLAACPTPTHSP